MSLVTVLTSHQSIRPLFACAGEDPSGPLLFAPKIAQQCSFRRKVRSLIEYAYVYICIGVVLSFSVYAQVPVPIPGKISEVTVYEGAALVSRAHEGEGIITNLLGE